MTPTPDDLARDLAADLAFLAEKDGLSKAVYSVEDDVDIAYRARCDGGWPAAIRRATAAETRVAELEALLVTLSRRCDQQAELLARAAERQADGADNR